MIPLLQATVILLAILIAVLVVTGYALWSRLVDVDHKISYIMARGNHLPPLHEADLADSDDD